MLLNHLAPVLAPRSQSQTICTTHMHTRMLTPGEHWNKTDRSPCNKSGLWPGRRAVLGAALAGDRGYAASVSICPTETSSTPQASQPGMPMDALALCPRACLMDHQQRVTNSSCKLQSNPLITLGKSQLEKRHAQFTSVRVALV